MNKYVVTDSLESVLSGERPIPTAVMWNRLEGRPRRTDFTRALAAEVRDPLWMIARQWQMGEYEAEDAGSPVGARVAWQVDEPTAMRTRDGDLRPLDDDLPLEARVEARPVPLERAGRPHNTDLRLLLGRRWRRLLVEVGHGDLHAAYRDAYPFEAPDPDDEDDFPLTAHAGAWQVQEAVAARAVDGGALLSHLRSGARASEGLGLADPTRSAVDDLGDAFLRWAEQLWLEPDRELRSWNSRRLEYSAELAVSGEDGSTLSAPDYRGGRLDWFHFDAGDSTSTDAPAAARNTEVRSFLPVAAQFDGMPHTRYWSFEDGAVSFGDVSPDTTDLAKLLLVQFGLIWANDWFLLPIELPAGTLTRIRGLSVTTVFGERFWIEPAVDEAGPVRSWQMFRLAGRGGRDERLYLAATAPPGLESAPVEEVHLVRDEVSNMVWGIETTVQLPDGSSRRGREVALELRARHQDRVPPPSRDVDETGAEVRYRLMRSVPEHWIPFVPVHVEGGRQEVQLQRASMPRLLEGAEGELPERIEPRTGILREGLDRSPAAAYHVAEEDVERAGTLVETRWQRCRWLDGRVVSWLGHRRRTGRGEGSGGLAFDQAVPNPPGETEE